MYVLYLDKLNATLNRSGARLVLLDASPSREEALAWAEKLNIVVIDR